MIFIWDLPFFQKVIHDKALFQVHEDFIESSGT